MAVSGRPCNKRRYRDHREAIEALHDIVAYRIQLQAEGRLCRRREVRDYKCDRCRGYHLTSQLNEVLA